VSAPGYVAQLLNGLDAEVRTTLNTVFEYVMRENAVGSNTKAENFSWFLIEGVTSTSANTEFSVEHGMDRIPSKLVTLVLPLNTVNATMPDLTVSRAADIRRVYLKSSVQGATFQAYLE